MAASFLPVSALFLFFLINASSFARLQRFEHPPKDDGSLTFLVVGDWGRRGAWNQSLVAHQMGKVGEELHINFAISTGDNFYDNGLTSVDDVAFEESFTKIYTAGSLQKQWYSVLGNHDYRGNVLAQLNPILRKVDPRWLCLRSFIVNADRVAEIFFIDTTPFVEAYFTYPKGHIYDWREVSPREEYIATTLKELELGLRESRAKWKVVVGHHTIRSVGHHGDTQELIHLLLPLLRAYQVDFYINGHDHCLQHIGDIESEMRFLTSGGGSKAWRGDVKADQQGGLNFFYDGQGFMSMELREDNAEIAFYGLYGSDVLHRWTMLKRPSNHSTM